MIVSRTKNQVSCQLDADTVVLQPSSGSYFKLNEVGSRVWELISEPQPLSQILDIIQSEFEVDPATCEAEVRSFIKVLQQKKLASTHEAPPN